MKAEFQSQRDELAAQTGRLRHEAIEILLRLLAVSSENPPGDTSLVAKEVEQQLQRAQGIETRLVRAVHPIDNVVAVVRGNGPGRRLVFNGHLDTFGIGDRQAWSKDPYGQREDGKIFGRGASDMKGGIAAQLFAACRLAEVRQSWPGELVLVLCGDEETAGPNGTEYILENCVSAQGDAMMCADAGSPHVIRFGEKGAIWLRISACGRAGHGAHVHLGVSAIDRLLNAIAALRAITQLPIKTDEHVAASIAMASSTSEQISGAGETQTLKEITINVGTINGGSVRNVIADSAQASVDIRLPWGVDIEDGKNEVSRLLDSLPGISYLVEKAAAPSATDPREEIVQRTLAVCGEVLRRDAVATMRVGASEAPLFRARGIPSVVCGLTPFNMGAPDEYVLTEELCALGEIYALTAFDYLTGTD